MAQVRFNGSQGVSEAFQAALGMHFRESQGSSRGFKGSFKRSQGVPGGTMQESLHSPGNRLINLSVTPLRSL